METSGGVERERGFSAKRKKDKKTKRQKGRAKRISWFRAAAVIGETTRPKASQCNSEIENLMCKNGAIFRNVMREFAVVVVSGFQQCVLFTELSFVGINEGKLISISARLLHKI
jgi:hypothetical protein